VLYLAARVLLAAGDDEAADAIAVDLENRLQSQTTAFSGLIRGERALRDGQLGTAMREFRWAREEYDFWMVHYLAGLTYLRAEQYPEAFDEFDYCVRNKGEITDVFLADSATIRFFAPALYWLGRCHEGLGNAEAAGRLYEEYIALRGESEPPDELATDAATRLGD
jgi:tetratricopeptide (TPR) repeat protein